MLSKLQINKNIRIVKSKNLNETYQYEIALIGSNALIYTNKIGFNNPVNITKYTIWKKFGFCPPKLSSEERRKILKGDINPYSYYMGL